MVSFNIYEAYDATIGPIAHDYVTEPFAELVYDTLDPVYGEGGVLEPVTVVVDPERTVKEEYIEPFVEDTIDYGKDLYEDKVEPLIDTAQNVTIAALLIGVYALTRS